MPIDRVEAIFTAGLWAAATILLPMAALMPIDSGRVEARGYADAAHCTNVVVDMLRVCPPAAL